MRTGFLGLVSIALSVLCVGCGGGGGDAEPLGEAPLSHAVDIQPIWDANCDGCHTGGASNGGLALDDGFATLVGVPSQQLPTMDRITPGDMDASYLWQKLIGGQLAAGGSGQAMPQGGMLSQAELATVAAWILGGAKP